MLLTYKKLEKGEINYEDKEVDNFLFIFIRGLTVIGFWNVQRVSAANVTEKAKI